MDDRQDLHYEELYNKLRERGEAIHEINRKRIRTGLIILALLPPVLIAIRWLTGSDKAVFLLIWVAFMFAICTYLIGVEYIDNSLSKTLEEVTDREAGFDSLMPDSEQVHDRIHNRIAKKVRVRDE